MTPPTRRDLLLGRRAAPLDIRPRSAWAEGRAAKGPLDREDVKFLLVHHTLQPGNDYAATDVPRLLRGIYDFHTGAEKGWPDIAYNFFVDQFGGVWEGRTGSLAGPVAGSATGGNQGSSQLCCFLGDLTASPPTEAAQASMIALLAMLADRYGIDTSPGATVGFTSQGSNRWPKGAAVTAATISVHLDMSMTECPGAACVPVVRNSFPAAVSALRGSAPSPTTAVPSSTAAPATSAPASTATSAPGPTAAAPTTEVRVPGTKPVAGTAPERAGAVRVAEADGSGRATGIALVAGGVTAVVGALISLRRRRS